MWIWFGLDLVHHGLGYEFDWEIMGKHESVVVGREGAHWSDPPPQPVPSFGIEAQK